MPLTGVGQGVAAVPLRTFIAELNRRRVLRIATVYVVVGFSIIPIANNIFPPLDLPARTTRLVIPQVLFGPQEVRFDFLLPVELHRQPVFRQLLQLLSADLSRHCRPDTFMQICVWAVPRGRPHRDGVKP